MVVTSQLTSPIICRSPLTSRLLVLAMLATALHGAHCSTGEEAAAKYVNVKCDFESIPGGGCHLRESYCSLHTCICKPDYPINIADRLCIARHKDLAEPCTYSQECQTGSYCAPGTKANSTRVCQCKTGYAYSAKSKQCLRGVRGSACVHDSDCVDESQFCSLSTCDCMYGHEWFAPDEQCHKKSRYGEPCEQPINCKMHDEFSECEPQLRHCTCGQFLSRKYALDQVTNRCVSCPVVRYHNASNTCLPEKLTVEYSLLDRAAHERNSHQHYVYITLSMTPFLVFGLIGFIYRYVNSSGGAPDPLASAGLGPQVLTLSGPQLDYSLCVQVDLNGNPLAPRSDACLPLLGSPLLPDPPPPYEVAFKDLPPPYDQVVGQP